MLHGLLWGVIQSEHNNDTSKGRVNTLSKGHFCLKEKLGINANQSDKTKETGQRMGKRKGVCKGKNDVLISEHGHG